MSTRDSPGLHLWSLRSVLGAALKDPRNVRYREAPLPHTAGSHRPAVYQSMPLRLRCCLGIDWFYCGK